MTAGSSVPPVGRTSRPDASSAESPAGPSRPPPSDMEDAQHQLAAFTFGGPPRQALSASSSISASNKSDTAIGEMRTDFRFGTCAPTAPSPDASFSPSSFGSTALRQAPSGPTRSDAGSATPHLAATPTVEYGAFEYPTVPVPEPASGPSSPSRAYTPLRTSRGSLESPLSPVGYPYPLGESHRRNSIIARAYGSVGSAGSAHQPPTSSLSLSLATPRPHSPPVAKRSITCSNIDTVPASGRRPSILHSATMAAGEEVASLPMAQGIQVEELDTLAKHAESANGHAGADSTSARPPLPHATSSSSSAATITPNSISLQTRRRTSLMFKPKTLPSPIPPSLLARRGSLPLGGAANARGCATGTRGRSGEAAGGGEGNAARAERFRASFSGLQTYGGMRDVTSHRLYHRKESLVAVDPAGRVLSVGQGREAGVSGQIDTQDMASSSERVGARAGGIVDVRVGPGLEAVPGGGPSVSDDEGHGASLEHVESLPRQRRTSVPHNLRSTVRSPAQYLAADRDASLYPGPRSQGLMSDSDSKLNEDTRRAIRERYMSYDRAYRPAFSRNLSSSDESDELSLDRDLDCSRLRRAEAGEAGDGDGDGEGETDEVESLPTPGLDTAGGMEIQMGLAAGHAGEEDTVQVLCGEEELDVTGEGETGTGTGLVLERPGLEERGSDETVKGTETLGAPGEEVR